MMRGGVSVRVNYSIGLRFLFVSVGALSLTACQRMMPLATPSPPIITPTPIATISPSPTPQTITKVIPPSPLPNLSSTLATPYQVIDEFKQPQFTAISQQIFKPAQLPHSQVNFNAPDLLAVLSSTRQYFQRAQSDVDLQREGILGTQGVTIADIIRTLDFMVSTLQEDLSAKRPIRLQDANFLNANFRVIQWTAFNPKAKTERRVRMTKYAVFSHPGSHTPTPEFNTALYGLKSTADDERIRTKYTKQDVLKQIYEAGGKEFGKVEPLVYLDREGLESALMEGTVSINFKDGTSKLFNVDRHNEISFRPGVAATEQQRYWYFKPVAEIKGYGRSISSKISVKPGVTFAGDVLNIGLGRMVVTEDTRKGKPNLHMGIIADTGGAFLPNLHQLDFLAGVFDSKDKFTAYTRKLPEYTRAYILVRQEH
jgi:hypothetical protein